MNIIKNKTGRKNKINQTYTWPVTGFFTHKDLFALNPNNAKITMRVHVKSEIDCGKIKDIGVLHNGKGRPTNVLVIAPVTSNIITNAANAGVILHSEYLSQKVADIDNTQKEQEVSEKIISTVTKSHEVVAVN